MELIEFHLSRLHRSYFLEFRLFSVCTKAERSLLFVLRIAGKPRREDSGPGRSHREAMYSLCTQSTPKPKVNTWLDEGMTTKTLACGCRDEKD